jgi:hypothetical protein
MVFFFGRRKLMTNATNDAVIVVQRILPSADRLGLHEQRWRNR